MLQRLNSFLSLCLVSAMGAQIHAQQLPMDKIAQVEAELPADSSLITKDIANKYIIDRSKLMVDIVWTTEHLAQAKPTVSTTAIMTRIPPYINGEVITYPALYATLMDEIGITVGHDIYAQEHLLPVNTPLLEQPYAKGSLFKSMDPAILYFENAFYNQVQMKIICPASAPDCRTVEVMTRYALSLFLIAHECGHYVHGDQEETADKDKEEKADAFAWDVITKIAEAYHSDNQSQNDMIDQMFEAGAFAFLAFERQSDINRIRMEGGDPDEDATVALLDARISALTDAAGDLSGDILYLMPDDNKSIDYQPFTLQWTRPPTVLIVNGTELTVAPSNRKTLLLPSDMTVKVLAWSADGVAYSETNGQQAAPISLQYLPYISSASQTDIEAALTAKNWTMVLRMGTSDGGRKVGAWATHAVNTALEHCNSRVVIDPAPIGDGNEDHRARADANSVRALSTWGVQ